MDLTEYEVDLACLLARLRQIGREGYANGHWLLDRVITCDLPRMMRHASPAVVQAIEEAEA